MGMNRIVAEYETRKRGLFQKWAKNSPRGLFSGSVGEFKLAVNALLFYSTTFLLPRD